MRTKNGVTKRNNGRNRAIMKNKTLSATTQTPKDANKMNTRKRRQHDRIEDEN